MIAGCYDPIRDAGQPQTFDAGMCLGIIKGLHYLSRDVCGRFHSRHQVLLNIGTTTNLWN
jgi:hypothetical protein